MKRKISGSRKPHFGILINRESSRYNSEAIRTLITSLEKNQARYTIFEPNSAVELLKTAEQLAGVSSAGELLPQSGTVVEGRHRKFTALISCGGDGTFNLVSRSAIQADLPVGIIPLGKLNNIARSIHGSVDLKSAIERIIGGNYVKIDMGRAGGQPFFGSLGIGFIPSLAKEISENSVPRYAIGWSRIGSRAASSVSIKHTVIKVDSFLFEVSPLIFNVNLLSYSAGLPLTPASLSDDGQAEIIFDEGNQIGEFSSFTRLIFKRKYLYGSQVKLFRGREITCHPVKGRQLYLDGEIIKLPSNSLEIRIGDQQLKVLC